MRMSDEGRGRVKHNPTTGMHARGASPAVVNGRPVTAAAQAAVDTVAAAGQATEVRAKAMELAITANPDADTPTILAAAAQFETYLRTGDGPT